MMEMFKQDQIVPNSSTYEVVITNTSVTKFTIPDDSILRGKTIIGVYIRNQPTQSGVTAKSVSNRDLVTNNAMAAGFLSLYQDSKAIIQECPLDFFVGAFRQGWYVPVFIKSFSPSTSYVTFADSARVSLNQAVEITFIYQD